LNWLFSLGKAAFFIGFVTKQKMREAGLVFIQAARESVSSGE